MGQRNWYLSDRSEGGSEKVRGDESKLPTRPAWTHKKNSAGEQLLAHQASLLLSRAQPLPFSQQGLDPECWSEFVRLSKQDRLPTALAKLISSPAEQFRNNRLAPFRKFRKRMSASPAAIEETPVNCWQHSSFCQPSVVSGVYMSRPMRACTLRRVASSPAAYMRCFSTSPECPEVLFSFPASSSCPDDPASMHAPDCRSSHEASLRGTLC